MDPVTSGKKGRSHYCSRRKSPRATVTKNTLAMQNRKMDVYGLTTCPVAGS